jgi:hypothetical protein
MGFLDALLGRTKPVKPDLDVLFAIPSAAFTLQATLDLAPTGTGAVCFRTAEGQAAARAQTEALALLGTDRRPLPPSAGTSTATPGSPLTAHRTDADLSALIATLHAINTTLVDAGLGSALLCTVIGFAGETRRLGLVYLFKRGTVYPFAPTGDQTRDTALELQVRAQLTGEIPVEADLGRWFPIWGTAAV